MKRMSLEIGMSLLSKNSRKRDKDKERKKSILTNAVDGKVEKQLGGQKRMYPDSPQVNGLWILTLIKN